jgi:hypothetical protein
MHESQSQARQTPHFLNERPAKMKRIGPKMLQAVEFVRENPGCAILPVAKHLHRAARNGKNNALGYNPVHRAIKAGLIRNDGSRRLYSLFAV